MGVADLAQDFHVLLPLLLEVLQLRTQWKNLSELFQKGSEFLQSCCDEHKKRIKPPKLAAVCPPSEGLIVPPVKNKIKKRHMYPSVDLLSNCGLFWILVRRVLESITAVSGQRCVTL